MCILNTSIHLTYFFITMDRNLLQIFTFIFMLPIPFVVLFSRTQACGRKDTAIWAAVTCISIHKLEPHVNRRKAKIQQTATHYLLCIAATPPNVY